MTNENFKDIEEVFKTIPKEVKFKIEGAWFLSSQYSNRIPRANLDNDNHHIIPGNVETISTNNQRYLVESVVEYPGGMSDLYRAWDTHADTLRLVKIAITLPGQEDLPELEALTMGKILHPNILPVQDYMSDVVTPFSEHNKCFVMSYKKCKNLAVINFERSYSNLSLPIQDISQIINNTGSTLHTLRTKYGIAHRDLKPNNVLIENESKHLFLTDFGLASGVHKREESVVSGSPLYIPPEGYDNDPLLAESSDVHTLGVMTYELLTSKWPFEVEIPLSTSAVMKKILLNPPIRISSMGSIVRQITLPIANQLDYVLEQAFEKDKRERQQTIPEFLNQLTPILERVPLRELKFE